jgi:predicted GH43/DUF377 family glycosyl hydrolase
MHADPCDEKPAKNMRKVIEKSLFLCAFLSAAVLSSCGRYGDFTLPPPETAGPKGPFTWSAMPEPVIAHGESSDVLNPSVVRFHGEYFNLYSEYDGSTWHTALARSADGVKWEKRGRILSPDGWEGTEIAANGSAVVAGDEILYWYQAGDPLRIALARSKDGVSWSKLGAPVVERGPLGSFDESVVADPYVIQIAREFYLFYLGQDRARRQRLGVARSSDGEHWEKLRSNPILELGAAGAFDENGLGEPAVWSSGGWYWMLYTGRDRGERRRIGLAQSSDGVRWTRDASFPPIAGDQPWDREVMCDPTVEVLSDQVRVWFGGGDVPSPDSGLHGQIGLGFLK